ncbi:MAG: TetR/AcrR family transcriptional regulator [Alphaproteobacteria bacterium]|nr:TetR/AcrR family transcriptional regulator [Alphaproteobacteria bacterium]MBU6471188.1 TetR/AcrR family transcriptional regulator [Alphaproteobacteria bacterium]MDE2012763.1 TetR/AcrR family transcriptional regulator [Alphaproteobacteria bacterium]MDE2074123.1 TetR/AcrR family transcriptional regulator [Alphaproteobacteria bacterium]MDE2353264.1 TetR/AcrR family transcriptional regulator [Alphaproteobacteria bacterium]
MTQPTPRKRATHPSLAAKKRPSQQRAAVTYEHILAITAELLGEVGFERLSTNLVCARAGLTPPALYQYFPNKYALLSELGQRLMQRQNEVIPRWINREVFTGSVADLEKALTGLILDTYSVTKQTPGGVWILRALRAVPLLEQVRLDSHKAVAAAQTRLLGEAFPDVPTKQLALVSRVAVDLPYAAVEMLFDVKMNARAVAQLVAAMIASQLDRLRSAARG